MTSMPCTVGAPLPVSQAVTARLPAASARVIRLPAVTVAVIDGSRVPVIRPYHRAEFTGSSAFLVAANLIRVFEHWISAGGGSLAVTSLWRASAAAAVAGAGQVSARIGVIGKAVLVAEFTGSGMSAARIGGRGPAAGTAEGVLSVAMSVTLALDGALGGEGVFSGNAPQFPTHRATGTLAVAVVVLGPLRVDPMLTGGGVLDAQSVGVVPVVAGFTGASAGQVAERPLVGAEPAFASTGFYDPAFRPIAPVTAELAGAGGVNVAAIAAAPVDAGLVGNGQLSAQANDASYLRQPNLTGGGLFTVLMQPLRQGLSGGTGELTVWMSVKAQYLGEFSGAGAGAAVQQVAVLGEFSGAGLGSAVAQGSVGDNFNRQNGGLGSDYITIDNAPVIATNRAQAGTPGNGSGTVLYGARHKTPLTTGNQQILFTVINPDTPAGQINLALNGGCFLRGSATDPKIRVEALVSASQAFIVTRVGSVLTRASGPIPTPSAVRFTAIGNTYRVYINGSTTPAATWMDTDGAIGTGTANLSVGVVTFADTSFGGATTRGYAIDEFSARDT
ncbi:hypothetical protein ACIBCN_18925 [Nocardia sp. NPDC051052]|uniref:hypothetical protein n=1 Tax=Nocardia sp. NPDC051052 TaxID=3364322 RepID=UPI00379FFC5A